MLEMRVNNGNVDSFGTLLLASKPSPLILHSWTKYFLQSIAYIVEYQALLLTKLSLLVGTVVLDLLTVVSSCGYSNIRLNVYSCWYSSIRLTNCHIFLLVQ